MEGKDSGHWSDGGMVEAQEGNGVGGEARDIRGRGRKVRLYRITKAHHSVRKASWFW